MSSFLRSPISSPARHGHRLFSSSAILLPALLALQALAPLPAGAATAAPTGDTPVAITINGRVVPSEVAPLLRGGSVFVPLRGPLEALGAKVDYNAKTSAITITQNGQQIVLNFGSINAVVGTDLQPLTAPPQLVNGRAFVPLRSMAEIFGYGVEWNAATRQVRISTTPRPPVDHVAALAQAGSFGVTVDFTDAQPADVDALLDKVKESGARLLKTRFDWQTLQPKQGAAFQWAIYDQVMRGAKTRGLTVVGILGVSATWASRFAGRPTTDPTDLLYGPPGDKTYANWSNYVSRVVTRYRDNVHEWQVWENPNPTNFRGPAKLYRILTRLASDAARKADPNALLFAADPGGVDLTFINDLARNGATNIVDGVAVYPTSQLQPGAPAPTLQFVRSVEAIRAQILTTGRAKNVWVGGLGRPVVEAGTDGSIPGVTTNNPVTLKRLQDTFTPQAQADYLVRSATLALAAGAEKVFYSALRDPAAYPMVDPMSSDTGVGLLQRDGTPRPSFAAMQTLAAQASRPFSGTLSAGPDIVALVFDDGNSASICAWSLNGPRRLIFNLTGIDPQVPNSLYIATRSDSQVLSSTGQPLATDPAGEVPLTDSPVWITNVGHEAREAAKAGGTRPFVPVYAGPSYAGADSVSVDFGRADGEQGLSWRQFSNLRGAAQEIRKVDGRSGLATIAQQDVTNPNDGRPFIFLDVADDFLFFERGVPVQVTVEVKKPLVLGGITNTAAAFHIEYSTPDGFRSAPYTVVPPGDGWESFTFDLPDASFANTGGYDLLIYTGSSRQDLTFGSVTIRRAPPQS